jgi:hypothetical protein
MMSISHGTAPFSFILVYCLCVRVGYVRASMGDPKQLHIFVHSFLRPRAHIILS